MALALAGLTAFAGESSTDPSKVSSLAWLAGTWSFERNGRVVTEQWMEPAGGTMLGMSRTVANGKTVEHEFVLLRETPDGKVQYVARPSGQAEAAFTLVKVSPTEAVFENPAHDFPQRVVYALRADGTLLAAIEGTKNGKSRRAEFPYRRVNPK